MSKLEIVIKSPGKYIQGAGVIHQLAHNASLFGKKIFIIFDSLVYDRYGQDIINQIKLAELELFAEVCSGECCHAEINRIKSIIEPQGTEVIIGVGGGKTLDTAKMLAHLLELPIIIVPTIASTDAPTSALSVIYTPEGQRLEVIRFHKNPDVVLVDTHIICQAPVRLLIAGMGDALATYFEARAVQRSGKKTSAGGLPTQAAFALAQLCYQVLLRDGLQAKCSVEHQLVSKALEHVVEANTYLSGIGFESGGLAAAHSIHDGLMILEECHSLYHGEKVAFGTLVQLVLENSTREDIKEVLDFCQSVGLPTCLKDLGVEKISQERLLAVARKACVAGGNIHNMPFPVTPELLLDAILTLDYLAQNNTTAATHKGIFNKRHR